MKDRDPLTVRDDTEGNMYRADTERDETADAEGHKMMADAEQDETHDTDGHNVR